MALPKQRTRERAQASALGHLSISGLRNKRAQGRRSRGTEQSAEGNLADVAALNKA